MLTKLDMFFHFLRWADFRRKGVLFAIKKAWRDAQIIKAHHEDTVRKINNFDEKDLFN